MTKLLSHIVPAIWELETYSEKATHTNYVTATEVINSKFTLNRKLFMKVSFSFIGWIVNRNGIRNPNLMFPL